MKQPHIHLDETIGAKCAILPGDPGRIDVIKTMLEDVQTLEFNREYRSVAGSYKGMKVIAMSTGMGSSSATKAEVELSCIGGYTLMRVGSCGAYQEGIGLGDLVLVEGAVRDDGASRNYIDVKYPAVPDWRLVHHCVQASKDFNIPYHTGIVLSHETFYHDESEAESLYWSAKGVLGADFESAALFTVGRLRKVYTGSILNNVVIWGQDAGETVGNYSNGASLTAEGERREILVALEAMYRLQQEL